VRKGVRPQALGEFMMAGAVTKHMVGAIAWSGAGPNAIRCHKGKPAGRSASRAKIGRAVAFKESGPEQTDRAARTTSGDFENGNSYQRS